jgi:uncharacterized membrane protein YcaP (DUF421 family)
MWIVLFRTILIYLVLMLFLRLLGKRQLGEMELSEFVVAALIADLAAYPLEEANQPLLAPLAAIAALSLLELLTAWLSLHSIRLRALLYGRPSLIIDHGKIDQAEMRRNRFTPDELMQAMRSSGVLDINEVLYAILETNGKLSVIPIAEAQPVTAGQMGVAVEEASYPSVVISDGRVMDQNLRRLGFDRAWLEERLREQGHSGPKSVFLMTADEDGNIFFCAKDA